MRPAPRPALAHPELRETFATLQDITRAVREVRATAGVGPRKPLELTVKAASAQAAASRRTDLLAALQMPRPTRADAAE